MLLFNHLQPPFNNPKLLRALLPAIDQARFMQAAVGADPAQVRTGIGFFTPGLGMESKVGLEALTGPRDLAAARKLVAESGYSGEKAVILATSNGPPEQQAICEVARELFVKLDLNVEYVDLDQGALEKRRLSREPAEKGGWSVAAITYDGLSAADPSSHPAIRGNGTKGFFGWPTSPELEALRDRWFVEKDVQAQKQLCEDMQHVAWEQVPFMPLGHWFSPTALRTSLTGVLPAPFPIFWNVRRIA